MKNNLIIRLIVVMLFIFLGCLYLSNVYYAHSNKLVTYFTYKSNDLKTLHQLHSEKIISREELRKWDAIVFNLIKDNKIGDAHASRIYAYLYVAQHDTANLSYNANHRFSGSIDAISAEVLCAFFQNQCDEISLQNRADDYSNTLANIVMKKIHARIETDNAGTKNYTEKQGNEYWAGTRPYFAQDAGTWLPWAMKSSNQFRAPAPTPPNDIEWQHQLQMTKTALKNITNEQKKLVVFWAGNPGTVTPAGQWQIESNDYMWLHPDIPLTKILQVRAVLAISIADAVIAVYDSKYTYWIRRPNMLDKSLYTIMPTPNHPSYPAGHATISSAAAVVLEYYLPNNTQRWTTDEFNASSSRTWGGIHFPIDSTVGNTLGKQVGKTAIDRLK